jgi:phage replication-related protein YjqB (UPF0714/DUF867 family)
MERYQDFENLKKHEYRGTDYRIVWRIGTSGIAVFCIHGGEIEPGTTRIANAIAGWEHSFYAFEGVKNAGNLALHITSNRFDEPTALEIVCQSEIVISIHGSAKMEPVVELGGLDDELKHQILHELHESGFQADECGSLPFCATNPANICNLCGRGMGVQMEISRGLRAKMFRDLTPAGRRYQTVVFVRFTESVRKAIAPFAAIYEETRPLLNTD